MRYVPSTVIVGERGHVVTRGYIEIGGVKIYDDQVVVGERGQRVISKGWIEPSTSQTTADEAIWMADR